MALGLLWLGLVLLGALQTQAKNTTPNLIPAPSLHTIPLQPNFENVEFQWKWYVLGLAGNEINNKNQNWFKMYATTHTLNKDNSYNVTSSASWNQTCVHWYRIFTPTSRKGVYYLSNPERYTGIQRYILQVVGTDYYKFAIVFFKKIYKNQKYFTIALYGRSMVLTATIKEIFVRFAKSTGLTDHHMIFSIPIDKCVDN